MLRSPFYDTTRSTAWNYGAIGATIGHEISHGFDSDGRRYDEHGDLRDWWNHNDAHEYKKRAVQLAKLFDMTSYRGMEVNGYLTLVENIADLCGIRFAIDALRLSIGTLRHQDLNDFFTAYAVSWRSKDRYKKAAQLLEIDPHAPPRLRVNMVVSQIDEWYEAYDIGSDHPDYVKPEDRIWFFGKSKQK
jgi:predicted metalloendopeptidase